MTLGIGDGHGAGEGCKTDKLECRVGLGAHTLSWWKSQLTLVGLNDPTVSCFRELPSYGCLWGSGLRGILAFEVIVRTVTCSKSDGFCTESQISAGTKFNALLLLLLLLPFLAGHIKFFAVYTVFLMALYRITGKENIHKMMF